jgi:SAM-dependent methyltransferase
MSRLGRLAASFMSLFVKVGRVFGYEVAIRKRSKPVPRDGLNLNIAAGHYEIAGFVSLDFYSDHYYGSRDAAFRNRVHYDMRSDALPYASDSVDSIYISHAIEHVETEHVERFVQEAFRVLKEGGVLRVVCPDAEFLYDVSQFENAYWSWREPSIRDAAKYECQIDQMTQGDYLIRELASPRMRFYRNRIPSQVVGPEVVAGSYDRVVMQLRSDLTFRSELPGDHINNWDFARLQKLGRAVGFGRIIRSKPGGSISRVMQGPDIDLNAPQMSLYVDFVKHSP